MVTRMVVTGLIALSLSARLPVYSAGESPASQTTQDSRIEEVRSQIKKLGVGEAVTISLIGGRKARGFLAQIGNSDFELTDGIRETNFTFRYEEVVKIEKGIDLGFKKIQVGDDRAPQTTPASDSPAEAVKSQITSLGTGAFVRVSHIEGKKVYGLITRVGDYDFEITDFTNEVTFHIRYSDVKEVIQIGKGFDPGFKKIQVGADRSPQTASILDSRAEAVKLQITSLGIGAFVRISHIEGRKFSGLITVVGDSDFEITDIPNQVTFSIRYGDVKKVDKVDKDRSRRMWLWASTAAVGAGAIIAVVLVAKKSVDRKFPPSLIRR